MTRMLPHPPQPSGARNPHSCIVAWVESTADAEEEVGMRQNEVSGTDRRRGLSSTTAFAPTAASGGATGASLSSFGARCCAAPGAGAAGAGTAAGVDATEGAGSVTGGAATGGVA
eukprot:CAMPEP_0205893242 /NCGR_PEP_ID=MMETSP1083-20121108/23138_1 /ASSEMBLY_ACC=CAM_ASM_000430 /TAXON_ID=97485 /ORGANISM="Prymnesium parvum, Strain Texoma1" /LENGTH=114 /DNA_ID=CAMNT_0053257879 /DNA_START=479 /DNA_END=820 /DNA_ORIENTATION=+